MKSFTLNTLSMPESALDQHPFKKLTTRKASDHLPIIADFRLKSNNTRKSQPVGYHVLPGADTLQLTIREHLQSLQFFDMSGNKLHHISKPVKKGKRSIKTQSWQPGLYFMKWATTENSEVMKIRLIH